MVASDVCLKLVKKHEGCKLRAYQCPSSIWTIGYGHTGKDVRRDTVISKAQAEEFLVQDLDKFSKEVTTLLNVHNLKCNQNQFDAMVSFAFNAGTDVLRRIGIINIIDKANYADKPKITKQWLTEDAAINGIFYYAEDITGKWSNHSGYAQQKFMTEEEISYPLFVFRKYIKNSFGVPMPGLFIRRTDECELFLKE